jgi:ABC-type transport system involved in multi-copper enzyme maturation permease subunit
MSRRASQGLLALTQMGSIALNTFREAVRSRVFYILLAFAVSLLVFSSAMGFLSIGNLRRVILDMGLSTISGFSALTAIFIGIGLIYTEIERKTIYNILSKPLARHHFLLGRYAGLLLVLAVNVALMVLVLSAVLMYFGGFTAEIFPAVGYIYLELMILTAVALFFSSVSSPVVSAICTVAFYLIGHTSSALTEILAPQIKAAWAKQLVTVLYHVLPDLGILSINNLVVHEIAPAPGFAWRALLYTACTVTLLLLAAALALRRRDLL